MVVGAEDGERPLVPQQRGVSVKREIRLPELKMPCSPSPEDSSLPEPGPLETLVVGVGGWGGGGIFVVSVTRERISSYVWMQLRYSSNYPHPL